MTVYQVSPFSFTLFLLWIFVRLPNPARSNFVSPMLLFEAHTMHSPEVGWISDFLVRWPYATSLHVFQPNAFNFMMSTFFWQPLGSWSPPQASISETFATHPLCAGKSTTMASFPHRDESDLMGPQCPCLTEPQPYRGLLIAAFTWTESPTLKAFVAGFGAGFGFGGGGARRRLWCPP